MNCDHKDCQKPFVITWLNIGRFCSEHFNQEYIRRYPEALTEDTRYYSKRGGKMKEPDTTVTS